MSHHVALRRSGQAQPNLEGMNTILRILKEKTDFLNTILRTLLHKYLPLYKAMDPSFMRNFNDRALQLIIQDPCQRVPRYTEGLFYIGGTWSPTCQDCLTWY